MHTFHSSCEKKQFLYNLHSVHGLFSCTSARLNSLPKAAAKGGGTALPTCLCLFCTLPTKRYLSGKPWALAHSLTETMRSCSGWKTWPTLPMGCGSVVDVGKWPRQSSLPKSPLQPLCLSAVLGRHQGTKGCPLKSFLEGSLLTISSKTLQSAPGQFLGMHLHLSMLRSFIYLDTWSYNVSQDPRMAIWKAVFGSDAYFITSSSCPFAIGGKSLIASWTVTGLNGAPSCASKNPCG